MARCKLRMDLFYYMDVVTVSEPKPIPGRAGEQGKYVFYITFVDKYGEQLIGEYLTYEPFQQDFRVGFKQRFKCIEKQQMGDIILPLPDSTQEEEKAIRSDMIGNINAHSYTIAALIAKDIFINANGAIDMNDDMWEQYFDCCDRVEAHLIKKRTQQAIGE